MAIKDIAIKDIAIKDKAIKDKAIKDMAIESIATDDMAIGDETQWPYLLLSFKRTLMYSPMKSFTRVLVSNQIMIIIWNLYQLGKNYFYGFP